MSIVTVQMGQCGNQVGSQLFDTINHDLFSSKAVGVSKSHNVNYIDDSAERFFDIPKNPKHELRARAVLVDTESKVISKTLEKGRKSERWAYRDDRQFVKRRGAGNNWAQGYRLYGPASQEEILDLVRKEVEHCDRLGGFLTLNSLAGGTGSGLGTYVAECLRDDFPHSFIFNQAIWPYASGEVIVQHYNALLTLSHLHQCTDAMLVVQNDQLHNICSRILNIAHIDMMDMNSVISHQLASILQPVGSGRKVEPRFLGDILQHLVPSPEYRLLTLRSIPMIPQDAMEYSLFMWPGLLKTLRQMLRTNWYMEEGMDWHSEGKWFRSLANLLIVRGKGSTNVEASLLKDKSLYPSWVPSSNTLSVWNQNRQFCKYERCASLLSNCQSLVPTLDAMVSKSWKMFSSSAYVHRYLKHGLQEEEFMDCFAVMEQIIGSYKDL